MAVGPIPDGSIYFWMYSQGLRLVDHDELMLALLHAGRKIRLKDEENYWNGVHNARLYRRHDVEDAFMLHRRKEVPRRLEDFPANPLAGQEIANRYVPCSMENRPLIRWGEGCMRKEDAEAQSKAVWLAENVKGCGFVILDVDGDHDARLDRETIDAFWHFSRVTECWRKPRAIMEYPGYGRTMLASPASFHLKFATDRLVPTMHFPEAHLDLIGNAGNSLRYFKDKECNGMPPHELTPDIWEEIMAYVAKRKENL